MADLAWFELYPPRELVLADVARFVRVLATRSRVGPFKYTPPVVFELRIQHKRLHWLMGLDRLLTGNLPGQLLAQLPRLGLVQRAEVSRPCLERASNVRVVGMARPLRLDVAADVSAGLFSALTALGKDEAAVIQWVVGPSRGRKVAPVPFDLAEVLGFKPPTPPEPGQQEAWKRKVQEPLFAVRGRIGATTASLRKTRAVIYSLAGILQLANAPHTELRVSHPRRGRARALDVVYRPGATWSAVINGAELASLLGWPVDGAEPPAGTGSQLNRVPKRLLVLPDAADQRSSRIVGESLHPADRNQRAAMPLSTMKHHTFVTGVTGAGKSTLLANWVLADAQAGYGVTVLEPRGDLIEEIIARLPDHRRDDLVVVEPADDDQVGFNPLSGPLHEAERRADELVSLFHELYGPAIGPRSADVLLHSLLTAARLDDGSLADVPVLLGNAGFRRKVVARVSDPLVLGPWWAWFESRSDSERQQIVMPVLNKLRAFLSRRSIRRMLGQARPKFSLDELFMKRPRVVLINLNRGVVGKEVCRLLGALWLSSIWNAAQRRATLPQTRRFPVSLVVDEFQDFLGALDFGEVLAQSRALSMPVTAVTQHLAALSPAVQAAVAANARSRLAFRPSPKDIKALAELFGPPVTPADLERLGAFQACARLLVDRAMTPPFEVRTLALPPGTADVTALRQASRDRNAVNGVELDKRLTARWRGETDTPDGPVGVKRRRPS